MIINENPIKEFSQSPSRHWSYYDPSNFPHSTKNSQQKLTGKNKVLNLKNKFIKGIKDRKTVTSRIKQRKRRKMKINFNFKLDLKAINKYTPTNETSKIKKGFQL